MTLSFFRVWSAAGWQILPFRMLRKRQHGNSPCHDAPLRPIILWITNRMPADCSNINCKAGQYRQGTCSGIINGYICRSEPLTVTLRPFARSLASLLGPNDIRILANRIGTHRCRMCGWFVVACSDNQCSAGWYRTGRCSGTFNGYYCWGKEGVHDFFVESFVLFCLVSSCFWFV